MPQESIIYIRVSRVASQILSIIADVVKYNSVKEKQTYNISNIYYSKYYMQQVFVKYWKRPFYPNENIFHTHFRHV